MKIKRALSCNQPVDTAEGACDETVTTAISSRAGIKRSRRNEIWETGASSGMTFGAVQLMHKENEGDVTWTSGAMNIHEASSPGD